MFNIIKNTCKILFKRRSFILVTLILPIVLVFAFAPLYSSNSTMNVAIINNDKGALGKALEERLVDIKYVEIFEVDEGENLISDLIFHKYEMVLTINEDFTKDIINEKKPQLKNKALIEGENQQIINSVINSQVNDFVNISKNINIKDEEVDDVLDKYMDSKPNYKIVGQEEEKSNINSSVGIIFYLIFISAGLSCKFILEDEREGTKDRVLMSKVSEKTYYGGLSIVLFTLSSIPAIEYFIICKVMNYEFGFKKTYLLLVLLLITVLLSILFNILISTIVKSNMAFTMISTTLTVPIFMLSGAFWPYDMMGESLKRIGSVLPPRWFFLAIQKLQQGKTIIEILPEVGKLLIISIVLFLLSIFFTRKKIVLVKEKK